MEYFGQFWAPHLQNNVIGFEHPKSGGNDKIRKHNPQGKISLTATFYSKENNNLCVVHCGQGNKEIG